jgi:peptidoglycan/xylan/chitin deacetylase (PgdA/CDA1 family)
MGFRWPDGKRAALSLTFDDARVSQIDRGIPFLNKLGVKGTFYLTPSRVPQRLEGWKGAMAAGHELAHHSDSHPCTGNYRFSRGNALEDYTLERMAADLDAATQKLEGMLGVRPVSFAYPCGQKFVGRGEQAASYIPLIAKRFRSGRGYLDEAANDPAVCDLAALMGTGFDGLDEAAMRALLDAAVKEGRWLVFVGHDMGEAAHQTTDLRALEAVVRYAQQPDSGIWLDSVAAISKHVAEQRR